MTHDWLIKAILGFFAMLGFGSGCALGWYWYCRRHWGCPPHQLARTTRWNKRLARENKRRAKARARRHDAGEFTPSPWENGKLDDTKPTNIKRKT